MTANRRSFNAQMLTALTSYGLLEHLFEQDLFGKEVKPIIDKWMLELYSLCKDVKTQKIKDLEFQKQLEALYSRVNLKDLLKFVELDRVKKQIKLPSLGARSTGVDLSKVEGMPKRVIFGKQIFCLKKDRSIVPHGHDNMCTGFIVLEGDFHGRHWDRVEDHKDHYIIKPTIDRKFKPAESSTISDHKDNVHWFKALSNSAYVFNVHVLGYNPKKSRTGRAYLDPAGEKIAGGLIKAKKMSSRECHRKYG